nr:MAG TPA: hypothetical protein [Caudoviricetes sp.]
MISIAFILLTSLYTYIIAHIVRYVNGNNAQCALFYEH